jgi:hypothetical protein
MAEHKTLAEAVENATRQAAERHASAQPDLGEEHYDSSNASDPDPDVDPPTAAAGDALEVATGIGALPAWAHAAFPEGWTPPAHKRLWVVRMRANLTARPDLGDRICVLWNLSSQEEDAALRRCGGDSLKTLGELTKMTVRIVDGVLVDYSRKNPARAANVNAFWEDVGSAYRKALKSIYAKNHSLTPAETADFLSDCVAVASSDS